MSVDLSKVITEIKEAGPTKVRSVPMSGHNVNSGLYQIEVVKEGSWVAVAQSLPQKTALDLIQTATNRTICG